MTLCIVEVAFCVAIVDYEIGVVVCARVCSVA